MVSKAKWEDYEDESYLHVGRNSALVKLVDAGAWVALVMDETYSKWNRLHARYGRRDEAKAAAETELRRILTEALERLPEAE